MKTKWILALAGARALVCLAPSACTGESPAPIGDDPTTSSRIEAGITAAICATPATGCPCADAGAEIDCGLVYRVTGKHVDCAPGVITCEKGRWSACTGPTLYGNKDDRSQ